MKTRLSGLGPHVFRTWLGASDSLCHATWFMRTAACAEQHPGGGVRVGRASHPEESTCPPAPTVRRWYGTHVASAGLGAATLYARVKRMPCASRSASSAAQQGAAGGDFCRALYNMGKLRRLGDVDGVLALLKEVKEAGTATKLHYNVAISVLASARDALRAGQLFAELDALGQADAYSYGAYVSALCRAGKLDQAVGLVASMDSSNVAPNLVVYNTLLHGAVTSGDLVLARRIKLQVSQRNLGCNEMHLIGLLRLAGRERRVTAIAPVWTSAIDQLYLPEGEGGGGVSRRSGGMEARAGRGLGVERGVRQRVLRHWLWRLRNVGMLPELCMPCRCCIA